MAKTIKNSLKNNVSMSQNDIIKVPRATWFIPYGRRYEFDMGQLVPIGKPIEVLPGDTFNYTVSTVTKLLSPQIKPVLDTLEQKVYAFYCPFRILEKDFEKIYTGHTDTTQWDDDTTEVMSTVLIPNAKFPEHSVASYMGLPVNLNNSNDKTMSQKAINALSFRAYCQIWNYFFRDENIMESINVSTENTIINGATELTNNIYDTENSALNGGNLLPVCKKHDLFTSALPAPQKGAPVTINLANNAEVVNDNDLTHIDTNNQNKMVRLFAFPGTGSTYQTNFQTSKNAVGLDTGLYTGTPNSPQLSTVIDATQLPANGLQWGNNSVDGQDKNGKNLYGISPFGTYWNQIYGNQENGYRNEFAQTKEAQLYHNLKVDLSKATAISINDLRYAFQLQLIKETDARHGTRITEYLLGHWGVVALDSRVQIPEFLGVMTFNLNSITIPQTSGSGDTPQANLSAYSESAHMKHLFTKSFVEPGIIVFLTSIQQKYQTYSQRLDKFWTKVSRFDFYLPELKNIGEQPIKKSELYYTGTAADDEVFGYQEAWYEYHYEINEVMNKCSPYTQNNLSVYSYAEKFDNSPTLSPDFLKSNDQALKNTLAIPPTGNMKTFVSDFYFINKATRPLPKHCIPGLIDHSGKIII